jgi:hypothetical protein
MQDGRIRPYLYGTHSVYCTSITIDSVDLSSIKAGMTTEDRGRRLSLIGGLSDLDGVEGWRKHVWYCDGSLKGRLVNVQVILQGVAQMRATLLSIPGDGILKVHKRENF